MPICDTMSFSTEERKRVENVLSAIEEFGEITDREGGPEVAESSEWGTAEQEPPSPHEFAHETTEEEIEQYGDVIIEADASEDYNFALQYKFPSDSEQIIAKSFIDSLYAEENMTDQEVYGIETDSQDYLSEALEENPSISQIEGPKYSLLVGIELNDSTEEITGQLERTRDAVYQSLRKVAEEYDVEHNSP